MAIWAFLHRFKQEWPLLAPVLGVCALGMGFGWYYYWQVGQFDPTSRHFVHPGWWPLVSDSPNAVAVWVVAAVAWAMNRRRWWWLDSTAFLLNTYVGLWTTFVFLAYPERMGTFDWAGVLDGNMNPVLFISHMGMPLLALVLVRDLRRDAVPVWAVVAMVAAMGAFVFVDYWGPHLHPAPFLHPDDGVLHAGAPWLMAASLTWWFALTRPTSAMR